MKMFNGAGSRKMWTILNGSGCNGQARQSQLSNDDVNDLNNSFVFNNGNIHVNSFDFGSFSGELDGFAFSIIRAEDLSKALLKVTSNSIGTDGFPIKFIKLVFLICFTTSSSLV